MNVQAKTKRSQAFFNGFNLSFYDFIVSVISPLAWRCPLPFLIGRHQQLMSNNHLEVGPGTGFVIDQCNSCEPELQLVLMDLSEACLQKSAKALARFNPRTCQQNILEPVEHDIGLFESIGINYVFHCVPGSFKQKGVAFEHLANVLKPGGVLFGCSVLSQDVEKNLLARAAMGFLQSSGIFNNQEDNVKELTAVLEANFVDVKVELRGPTAVFSARKAGKA